MSPPPPPLPLYRQNDMEKHLSQKRAEKQQITEQQAEEARLQLEEKLERCGQLKSSAQTHAPILTHIHRCNRLKRMDDYQRQQQGIRVEQEKLR